MKGVVMFEYRFHIVSARGETLTPWRVRKIDREELDEWIEDFEGATVTAERREITHGPTEAYEPPKPVVYNCVDCDCVDCDCGPHECHKA